MNRLKKMSVEELTDIMWWLIQAEIKNDVLFSALQREIKSRMNAMKDSDLLTFLSCFTDSKSGVSIKSKKGSQMETKKSEEPTEINEILDNFMYQLLGTTVNVIRKKLTKFELKTLVGIVWTFSRLNLQAEDDIEILFTEIKEELIKKLLDLKEKNLAILLWCYSRQESPDQEFLEKLKICVKNVNQPSFDNFDLMLIVQA